ncbi:class I SAM-dependent methyltransferase [Flavobacterium granuli]|uniref:Methyltransferase domain-containing protein n=1 Tax=Flavobacterium granuli TaxID=280093 RepID=A0A1M5QLS9_9FLAO|nr:class I SAM-dependent methyltransferase [Flavobacterium granuli]PRZ20075.1 methyltransferase family protein [Flavobacterium granuli]SHH14670.1 Methyltransferase domain-containing protein [Flavobacterium granuli]
MLFKKIAVSLLKKNKKTNYILKKVRVGKSILEDECFKKTVALSKKEINKSPSRSEIINFLMSLTDSENYLEIGVRNPKSNFLKIKCNNKYSVDPGLESEKNVADFAVTSDVFFELLEQNKLNKINSDIKFDVIFIDGLHLSFQVEKDILNSLKYIKDDGFIVLHDCNPPTEYHQRENYYYRNSPAGILWNGTTWKAFYKFRHYKSLKSICFDTDWGVGVFSRNDLPLFNHLDEMKNEFYEFDILDENRSKFLNLNSFDNWVKLIEKNRS